MIELNQRIMIRDELIKQGINPYPHKVHYSNSIREIVAKNSILIYHNDVLSTVGRVLNIRRYGGSIFIDLIDEGLRLQVYLQKDTLGKSFDDFKKYVGRGDFLLVEGELFFTKSGELTLKAKKFLIISKALRDPPAKLNDVGKMHGGLKNIEERYRKR